MPTRDKYHFQFVNALKKDGWTITHDPLYLPIEDMDFFIDIGAEKLLTAQKGNQKIAVEIKTLGSLSTIYEFYTAIGQYVAYKEALDGKGRELFLAIPNEKYNSFFQKFLIQAIIRKNKIPIIVFNPETEEIQKWIQ